MPKGRKPHQSARNKADKPYSKATQGEPAQTAKKIKMGSQRSVRSVTRLLKNLQMTSLVMKQCTAKANVSRGFIENMLVYQGLHMH